MAETCIIDFSQIAQEPRRATEFVAESLFGKIYPLILEIRNKLQTCNGLFMEDDLLKMQNVYTLCTSQIKKCLQTLFGIFKTEYHEQILMQVVSYFIYYLTKNLKLKLIGSLINTSQTPSNKHQVIDVIFHVMNFDMKIPFKISDESRQYIFERLLWCVNRLKSIETQLDRNERTSINSVDSPNESVLITPMYFVNWIDHTFNVLTKLSTAIYKTDFMDNDKLYSYWKSDMVDCVSTLHISIDELLLSAMTLSRHCLPIDEHIIKARCQVVLRETKTLLSELIEGDLDMAFKATPDILKLPIMPSNVNVLIDVLKDVLYVLETNTNTALLALVVDCFSNSISPVDVLKQHFVQSTSDCSCLNKSCDGATDECPFVKEFDLYNERLLQIGSFAMSCSSDKNRILSLRSGLATLEALDPHLVPALMLSPGSQHSELLVSSWQQEVLEIKDSVFLIVDPAAFAEKSKQLMHQTLLETIKHNVYNNEYVCQVINIGCVVHDFFAVYNKYEPDALTHHEKLVPLLVDLNKVQMECKIVSNLLSHPDDFVYNVKKTKNQNEVSIERLFKRLKLLYTLVSRINSLLHPKENEDQLFDDLEEDSPVAKNITHTIYAKNAITYVNSPRKPANISRSIFARTTNIRSSTTNFPLSKLTKHLKTKKDQLSFSVKLDELFDLSEVKHCNNYSSNIYENKNLESIREPSILYNFSPKKRSSLRKAVLNKNCKLPFDKGMDKNSEASMVSEKGDLMDEVTSLQITDILNQMNDMTSLFSKTNPSPSNLTQNMQSANQNSSRLKSNILSINVNDANTSISKHIWNIPVNASTVEMPLDDSTATMASNITVPSNVTTWERINDIDLVESKLSSLKMELETSL